MALFYSASVNGFFADDVHDTLPVDAIRITPARHRALLAGQAAGSTIGPGEAGHPVLTRPASLTLVERRARAVLQVKREAARRIDTVAPIWRQINDMREPSRAGEARVAAITAIRNASSIREAEIATAAAARLSDIDIAGHPAWDQTA